MTMHELFDGSEAQEIPREFAALAEVPEMMWQSRRVEFSESTDDLEFAPWEFCSRAEYEAWSLQAGKQVRALYAGADVAAAIAAAQSAGARAEREACAEACEAVHVRPIQGAHEEYLAGKEMAVQQCARAIRLRLHAP